jgi:hypothetical protein
MSEPTNLPYAFASSTAADDGHLKTIAICHFVWGGLVMLFSSVFIIHIVLGALIVSGRMPLPASPTAPGMPPQFGYLFLFMGSAAVLIGWSVGILTILSGRAIIRRKWRIFSFVMAGVNCASVPFGTVLGVFTFVVLLRPSVRAQYPQ